MEAIFLPELNINNKSYIISNDEFNHIKALRLKIGDDLYVINGNGLTANCKIISIEKKFANIEITNFFENNGENEINISVAIGILDNRERMEFALEKSVELGVNNFYPLITNFSQRKNFNIERANQKIIAATKQCKRSKLMQIHEAQKFQNFINNSNEFQKIILADENGEHFSKDSNQNICIMIGPEGGFSPAELEIIKSQNNISLLKLGNRRLRAETALIAAISKFI